MCLNRDYLKLSIDLFYFNQLSCIIWNKKSVMPTAFPGAGQEQSLGRWQKSIKKKKNNSVLSVFSHVRKMRNCGLRGLS